MCVIRAKTIAVEDTPAVVHKQSNSNNNVDIEEFGGYTFMDTSGDKGGIE